MYWNNKEYYGVGLGASGYISGARYTNTKSLKQYLDGNYVDTKETLSKYELLEEFLLCRFRLEKGFKRKEFVKSFDIDFLDMFADKVNSLIQRKLLIVDDDSIRLSDGGMAIMDNVIVSLLD